MNDYYKHLLEKDIGKRCVTTDVEDFPDEEMAWENRCFICRVWESIDGYVLEKIEEWKRSQ